MEDLDKKIEDLTHIVEEQDKKINSLIEKVNDLEKQPKTTTPLKQVNRNVVKNILFEEAFVKCKKAAEGEGIYPCMYLPKSGKFKGQCCGSESVFVDNEEDEQIKIKGKVDESFFHSLRCNTCQTKGRANSESKKKCNEKIKGINVKSTDEVNTEALSFLSGNTNGVTSPTNALSKSKLPIGDEVEYDDHFHYLVPYNGQCFVFEHGKNKTGTPCIKKTPTLRGFLDTKEVDKDTYKDKIKKDISEDIINNLKKHKKFSFEGEIIKSEKEDPIIPQLNKEEKEEPEIDNDEMDDILKDLNIE